MNEDRSDRLRSLTAEAARAGEPTSARAEHDHPAAGDLYVLPETADYPVEWLLLDQTPDDPDRWLAAPADTNPLRGPGDLWLPPAEEGGPLAIRCRFGVEIPAHSLDGGHQTGAVSSRRAAEALEIHRAHEQGNLQTGPLAEEVAADPEYRDWERGVLVPAQEALAALATREETPDAGPSGGRAWLALAAALALLSIGLGAWNVQLHQRLRQGDTPVLIGGSQEIVVGSDVRAPDPIQVRRSDRHLLVFIVLEAETADHDRYRVELIGEDGTPIWSSSEVVRGPLPELTLMIPGHLFHGPEPPDHLVVLGVDDGTARSLGEVPIRFEPTTGAP